MDSPPIRSDAPAETYPAALAAGSRGIGRGGAVFGVALVIVGCLAATTFGAAPASAEDYELLYEAAQDTLPSA